VFEFDPYDSPPLALRIVLGLVCLGGAVVLSVYMLRGRHVEQEVAVIAGLLLSETFIAMAPTGVRAAAVAVLYWGLLGAVALLTPV
jgi:hypothetical protein